MPCETDFKVFSLSAKLRSGFGNGLGVPSANLARLTICA
jgi:hypothetical protein